MTTTLRTIPADLTPPARNFDETPRQPANPNASIFEICESMQNERHHGFLVADLQRTFDMVTNPADWRAPIHCQVPTAWLIAVLTAVTFYTATDLRYVRQDGDMHEMTSPGYRAGPAGDH